MIASMGLSQKAVATSGDYQKYFLRNGVRYHHILDPVDGMPARGPISATVVSDNVMDADALATAVFVLGADRGISLIDSLDKVEGMVVLEDGSARFSKGFQSQPEFVFHGFKNNVPH